MLPLARPVPPENRLTDALKVARLRRMAACARTVAAKAGYLALADAIEKARPSSNVASSELTSSNPSRS